MGSSLPVVSRVRKARRDTACCLCGVMIVTGNREVYIADLGRVAGWCHLGCAVDFRRTGFATFPAWNER